MSTVNPGIIVFDSKLLGERDYWLQKLSSELEPSGPGRDYERAAEGAAAREFVEVELRSESYEKLARLTLDSQFLVYTTLTTALAVCLHKYTGNRRVVVGSPALKNEDGAGQEPNALAVVCEVDEGLAFRQLLLRVREGLLEAYRNQHYPFARLLKDLGLGDTQDGCPLFDVALSLDGLHTPLPEVANDLTLTFAAGEGRLSGKVFYDPRHFRRDTVERFAGHFLNVLRAALDATGARVGDLSPLSAEEFRQVCVEWNDTRRDYPRDSGLHQLFEARAAAKPDAVAVVSKDGPLTFRELNARANQLARHLRALGVGPESLVGVCMNRSPWAVVSLLGVVKAGGAYVPLDPAYPAERLAFMLEDARIDVLLTESAVAGSLPDTAARVLCLDTLGAQLGALDADDLGVIVAPDNPVYVIYTSGSTGRPKGVVITHRGLVNYLSWAAEAYRADEGCGAPAHSSISFDLTVTSLFVPLLAGRVVRLVHDDEGIEGLTDALKSEGGFSFVKLTPAHLELLTHAAGAEDVKGWTRAFILGGEALTGGHVAWWRENAPATRLINEYGPTETVVGCCVYEVAADDDLQAAIPIGRPVANTEVYVLDRRLRPVPVGVPGELYVGGDGLARGYLGRPALTAERFVPDPFSMEPGARLYRTGDRAHWLAGGQLGFLGRADTQVKLRGYRVELGEVEAALAAHPAVERAVAEVREAAGGDRRLVAYLVCESGTGAGWEEVREQLRALVGRRLPDYMVPAAYVRLDALPLTANGKVDRRSLPEPEWGAGAAGGGGEGLTPAEELVAGVWAEVLGLARLPGAGDDFFELGGHSLLATRVVSRLREVMGADLGLRSLFEHPTVAGLARAAAEARGAAAGETPAPPLRARPAASEAALSYAQERLWFLDQLVPGSAFYNVPLAARVSGRLDAAALSAALDEVVRRHAALRTRFEVRGGRPAQVVDGGWRLGLAEEDLRGLGEGAEAEALRVVGEEACAPFDLGRGPVARGRLLRVSDDEWVVALVLHHIVSDGWSMGVLVRELGALYAAYAGGGGVTLSEPPVQYADFAEWQREWLRGEVLQRQLDFWKRQLAAATPLQLPTDRPRPAVESFKGAHHAFSLSPELTERLKAFSRREGVTLFMTLLAAFRALLHRYTGQHDILIGSPIANRNRREIEDLIGFFVNTLVLRTDLSGDPSFRDLLARERETALEAYAHQDFPFEKLVEEVQPERNLSQNPIFQVMFALQNAPSASLELPGLSIVPIETHNDTAKFDVTMFLWESDEGLSGRLEYNTDLFDAETVARLAGHFQTLIEGLLADPLLRLSEAPLLTGAERRQLGAWNETQTEYPRQSIHRLFEAQAAATPEAVALVYGADELTYAELNRRANQLARRLRRLGVTTESPVGLFMERAPEMIVALLAVLKSGGAYVPLDPEYPAHRLNFMARDARLAVLLTQEHLAAKLPQTDAPVVCVERDGASAEGESAENLEGGDGGEHLAYVMYTSGSTGKPKGVCVPHKAVVRLVRETNYVRLANDEVFLQLAPVSFDASTFEIWGALLNGARLALMPPRPPSLEELGRAVREFGVTTLWLTAGLFHLVVDFHLEDLAGVRQLLAGGDVLSVPHVAKAVQGLAGGRLINGYGPTEATTFTCCHTVTPENIPTTSVPIGRPVANTEVYVLDAGLRPVPVGVPGELYVGGDGLARGYLNRPALTAGKFIPHPCGDRPGERLYRTGDRARWLADGSIEFLGRLDHQVKVRGYRIEPSEIEAVIVAHEAVREVAVVAREDEPGDKRLVAYVVPDADYEAFEEVLPVEEIQSEQVEQWEMLFDQTYSQSALPADPTFNIAGWNSSYTREPIPAEEMREWLDDTVGCLRSERLGRVLEIGCGTGLILFQLAPSCREYVATDFSRAALSYIRRQLKVMPGGMPQVALSHRRADDFRGLESKTFDTVIFNSVAQYFPGVEYLVEVLEKAAAHVPDGGTIFVGDVRSLPMLETLHASVEFERAPDSLTLEDFRQVVRKAVAHDSELVISPAFFYALAERLPRISRVEIAPKRGRHHNELTRFRYQVKLHVGPPAPAPAADYELFDWPQEGFGLADLRRLLAERGPETLVLTNVPNARLSTEAKLLDALAGSPGRRTVGELRRAFAEDRANGPDPEELCALAEEFSYSANLDWSRHDGRGGYDAVLSRAAAPPSATELLGAAAETGRPWAAYANNPLRAKFSQRVVPYLRASVQETLPEYMMPSAFVVLDELPLTPNGKVDLRALPALDETRPEMIEEYVAPRDAVEEVLAGIWSQVLGIKQIGVHDDFFELGGHSLLATQVISRVREAFETEVPLRRLFESPTVAGLASVINQSGGLQQGPRTPPLRPVARDGAQPLSFAQQRLWFLEQLEPGGHSYNVPLSVRLAGRLDVSALERTLHEITRRHEVLRTTFGLVDGRPAQSISPEPPPYWRALDLGGLPEAEREVRVQELALAEAQRPFDLGVGPVLRATLLRLGDEEHVLLFTMHHIVSDGWSMQVLITEVASLYEAFSAGLPSPLAELPVQYADYAVWQREWLRGEVLQTQLDYWRGQLAGTPAVLDLPTDRPRPPVRTFRGARELFTLDGQQSEALRALSQEEGVTLFMTLLAAFQTLLHRYTHQTDINVGSPVAGRHRAELEPLIGFFVNTLVMRTGFSGDPSFREVLRRVRETALGAYAHQDLPFEQLVEALQPERELSHSPLFQVWFVLGNSAPQRLELPGLRLDPLEVDSSTAKFDLTLSMVENDYGMSGALEYNTDLFEAVTAKRMVQHFLRVLEGVAADRERPVSRLPLLSPAEENQLLQQWGRAGGEAREQGRLIRQLVEEQAARFPGQTAVEFDGARLSYEELNSKADQLAHFLRRSFGCGRETVVAVMAEPSERYVVAVLGVLKAGAAYVPIDPQYPEERKSFIMEDAGVKALIVDAPGMFDFDVPVFSLDLQLKTLKEPADNPADVNDPDDLAYVIYTSGTTGRPKGVEVTHRGLCNLVSEQAALFGIEPGSRVLQFASPGFDASVSELFTALACGATLHVAPRASRLPGPELVELLRRESIHCATLPPAVLRAVEPEGLTELRTVVAAGEACAGALVVKWGAGRKFINAYGPTETTVCATMATCDVQAGPLDPPIGRPIAGAQVYLLDEQLQPVPVGVSGELYVGGCGLARGYRNRPALTAERFVPDPFSTEAGARLYRTGDLARYLPDGNLEYMGRTDHQVKVRGFRIEPGEIEAALGEHEAVREAVVVAREDVPGERRLVAYVVADEDEQPTTSDLRDFLRQSLPEYMVPSAFVFLAAMPFNAHGKLDRRALPAPEQARPELKDSFAAPETREEELLSAIWAEVLRVGRVGRHDNFFELGGDSILSIQIAARAAQAGLRLATKDIFRHQTVASLAAAAAQAAADGAGGARGPGEEDDPEGEAPLLPIQRWFLGQEVGARHHFNHALLLRTPAGVSGEALRRAAEALQTHHDALRLRLREEDGRWRQRVEAASLCEVPFECVDLGGAGDEEEQRRALEAEVGRAQLSLDLEAGPVWRVVRYELGAGREGRLLVLVHHAAVDGVSWRVLLEDLARAYAQAAAGERVVLPEKTTSLRRWASLLEERGLSGAAEAEEGEYWAEQAKRGLEGLRLPRDYAGGGNSVGSSSSVVARLTAEQTRGLLREVARAYRAGAQEALLAALGEALGRWAGAGRVAVEVEGHGREEGLFGGADLTRTVGWFTSLYPVLLEAGPAIGPGERLKAVKEQLRAVPHGGLGYGVLRYGGAEAAEGSRRFEVNAEVAFNYLGQFDQVLNSSPSAFFSPAPESTGAFRDPRGERAYLLEVGGSINGGCLQVSFTYGEEIHRRDTIEALAQDFARALRDLIEHCRGPEAVGYTPSDFPRMQFDQAELDDLVAELGELSSRPDAREDFY